MKHSYRILTIILVVLALLAAFSAVAQQPAKEDGFTFTVFGDNRPSRSGASQSGIFKAVLKDMNALNPAFAVNTGDSIFGASGRSNMMRQYKDYTQTVASHFRGKVYLTLGNHEILGSRPNHDFFTKELGGSSYYSFDYGDAHFIVLNSEYIGQWGRITGKQLEWLKEDLEKSRAARFRFVFIHRPLYPVSSHKGGSMDKYPKDRDALHSLFVKNRITAVFAGHEHLFNQQIRNGVTYIITGGAGAPLYPSSDGMGDFHHYVAVTVNGENLRMKVIKPALNGKPREEIVLRK